MKANKQIIINEIIAEIEKGKTYTEVFGVIRSKSELAQSTFATYWKQANEQYSLTLQDRKRAIEAKTMHLLEKHAEKAILSKIKKLELLEEIALGSVEFEKVFFDKGVPQKIAVKPDNNDRMKAIEIHNKMTGDNEAEKITNTIKLGKEMEAEYV